MNLCNELERKIASRHFRGLPNDRSLCKRLSDANPLQAKAVQLADDIGLLARLDPSGYRLARGPMPCRARLELFDFILAELQTRVSQALTCIQPLVTYLKNQRDNLLDFVAQLDHDLVDSATAVQVAPELVRELFAVLTLDEKNPQRWQRDARLRRSWGSVTFHSRNNSQPFARRTVRAKLDR